MTIEITEFVNVSISVSPTGVTTGDFGRLGFLTNETGVIDTPERFRSYTSLTGVGDDWSASSEVFLAATAFYGQTPTPTSLTVTMAYETPVVATLLGGLHSDLASLQAIAGDGVLTMTIDSAPVTETTLDFSGAADLDEVALAVDTAIALAVAGSTCIYNDTTGSFELRGSTAGSVGNISFATGSVADALGLTQTLGNVTDGVDAETPVDALAAAYSEGLFIAALVTHKKYRDITLAAVGENVVDIAGWAEANQVIYMNTTNNLGVLNAVVTTDVASALQALTYRYSLTTFATDPSRYPSAAIFGRAASVNFDSVGSTITLNLKAIAGVVAEDLTPTQFAVLRSKYASAVVVIGASANAYTDSRMASGSWLDTTHGLLWLENRIETDMFNLLYTTATKIPYTQVGINMAILTLTNSLEAAVRNGLAAPGFFDSITFLNTGYDIQAVPLGQIASGDKSNRIYNGLSFRIVGAGALHEINITGQFTE